MEQKKKNEGIVALLLEAFDKGTKKQSEVHPDEKASKPDVEEEIKSLINSVKHLSDIVTHHNTAINELYLLQAHVLKQLKPNASLDSLGTMPKTTKKNNDEKPN